MPKSLNRRKTYKRRKSTRGGCGCNLQRGGYSLKKLSLIKSLKSKSKKNRRPIIMKGGLGGQTNTSLAFGTLSGAITTANTFSGASSLSGGDPNVVTFANNAHSLPMV